MLSTPPVKSQCISTRLLNAYANLHTYIHTDLHVAKPCHAANSPHRIVMHFYMPSTCIHSPVLKKGASAYVEYTITSPCISTCQLNTCSHACLPATGTKIEYVVMDAYHGYIQAATLKCSAPILFIKNAVPYSWILPKMCLNLPCIYSWSFSLNFLNHGFLMFPVYAWKG